MSNKQIYKKNVKMRVNKKKNLTTAKYEFKTYFQGNFRYLANLCNKTLYTDYIRDNHKANKTSKCVKTNI